MRSRFVLAGLVATIAAVTPAIGVTAECGLEYAFTHTTRHDGERNIYGDAAALFFTAAMAVNTDGAPNSYHPEDPWGSAKAINTICNGANARLPDGRKLNYAQCRELVAAFEEAKAAGWEAPGKPVMEFYGVAAKGATPCLIQSGPYAGYFVSTTSLAADQTKGHCDQERYLNSLEIPFSIYPGARAFTERGVGKGDVVVYFNPANDAIEFGVVGDRGPAWGLAEGSVAFAKTLRKLTEDPKNRRDTYRFGVEKVHALILPNETLSGPFTGENVRMRAEARFEEWGGLERFKDCVATIGARP
jgi:hypothetical protein